MELQEISLHMENVSGKLFAGGSYQIQIAGTG
jgi:hypothetical protein